LHETLCAHHLAGRGVVAQRLNLQPIVVEQEVTFAALVDLIGVNVEAAQSHEVAEAEVVAAHGWVAASLEGFDMPRTEVVADEPSGTRVVEDQALVAPR